MATREKVVPIYVEDEMRNSYIDYSMSVIISRALPDVRDGLKPVHRRVLVAMRELNLLHDRPFRKSAKITGRDEAGNAISLVAGESGDSARRLELNSNLISTLALLQAIGSMMVAFFGQVRIEENVTISEDGTILRPLDERLLDGVRYMVVEAETGLSEREQDLRLFEVTP